MKKVILYPPTVKWNGLFQRPHQILRQFARDGWTVIFCDNSIKGMEKAEENIFLTDDYEVIRSFLGFDHPDILYQTWPNQWEWVEKTNPDLVLYDVVDKFDAWEEGAKHMRDLADVTIYSAKSLQGDAPDNNHIPNACDSQRIVAPDEAVPTALDVREVLKPIIGFVGSLAPWVDVATMMNIADNYTLFIIGQIMIPQKIRYAYFTGTIPYKLLAGYYNSLDVGIVPFDSSETSMNASPIKMYEYLAAGLPVISSPIPEAVAIPEVTTVELKDFVEAIRNADTSIEARERRYQFSLLNTWEKRYEKIKEILDGQ